MRILDWSSLDASARRTALRRPRAIRSAAIEDVVRQVVERVRTEGDSALRALTLQYDGVVLESLQVSPKEWAATESLRSHAREALRRAITNVQRFHEAQRPRPLRVETEPGVLCEQIVRPIGSVGLYVPAGTAPLPSTAIMLAVPARIAGCPQRLLCTPPRADGTVHPAVLEAARLGGIETIFKVGGAQAIAALAYGTESIPRVDKIFGPGNAYVDAAKRLVMQDPDGAACDLPAGPSEVMIVADASARPDFVAADLLAQAEHDRFAHCVLVTDSRPLAEEVAAEVHLQRYEVTRTTVLGQSLESCHAIVCRDLGTAMDVVEAYAPEHLLLDVHDPRHWLSHVRSAGSVFIGRWSAEPFGDYCSGTNHVLPTGGSARSVSGLGVYDFVKMISVQELSAAAVRALGPTALALAGLEGLDAHANAVSRRLDVAESEAREAP